jgi:hypothetical protein
MEKEFKHLINLLGDNDQEVLSAVENAIIGKGSAAIPYLEAAMKQKHAKIVKQNIASIITKIRSHSAIAELNAWIVSGGKEILRGMYCIAKFIFHDIKYDSISRDFNKITAVIKRKIAAKKTAYTKITAINDVLFKKYMFTNNYMLNYDTCGHFIHLILDKKQINPLSLLLLYLCFGEKFGIDMKLITLPENFILLCDNNFYINPSMNGEICGHQNIKPYKNIQFRGQEYADINADCPDSVIMCWHLARAISEAYQSNGQLDLMKQITPAITALEDKM